MDMEVYLTGNKKVEVSYKGFSIKTDQPETAGGDNSAPSPFDLFLSSLGACAGFYALAFCQQRNIETKNIKLILGFERNKEMKMVTGINIDISVPKEFPDKYKESVIRAVEQCTVKKHLYDPPKFEIRVKNI